MSGIKWLKQIGIIIACLTSNSTVLANAISAEQNNFLIKNSQVDSIITDAEIDDLIENSIVTNLNASIENSGYITYYDYYFLINHMRKNTISNLLTITEFIPENQEEANIENDGQLIVNLNLNYQDIDTMYTIFKKEDNIFFPLKDLAAFDIDREYLNQGNIEVIDEVIYTSLKSLPGSRFHLNDETQVLELNFPPGVMKKQHFDANNNSTTSEFSHSANGAYLNYDITLSNSRKSRTMVGVQELNIFSEKGSGSTSALVRKHLTGKDRKTFIKRLESYWVTENENDLTRWTFGDSNTYSAPWSSSTRFGGVQYSSNFAIRPGIITHPLIDFGSTVESPTDISVYANTQQIYAGQAKTGRFNIDNLPVTTGSGNLIVKLKDITGKIQTVVIPYYNTPQLLNAGLTNFSYAAGMQRRRFGVESNKYKNIVTSFDYMHGISKDWTAGGHFESLGDIFSIGFTSINQLGLYGVIQTSLANTHRKNLNSQRGKIEYSFQGNKISFYTSVTLDRNGFPDTFISNKNYCQIKGIDKSLQTSIGYGDSEIGNFFLSFNSTKFTSKNSVTKINSINGSYSRDLTKDSMIMLSCGTSLNKNKKDRESYASLSYTINLDGRTINAGLYKRSNSKNMSKNLSISSSPDTLLGWGYNANLRKDDKYSSYDITVNNSSEIMDTSFYFFNADKARTEQISFMGSITEIDKSIYFSRPIDNSIALVKTSNFKNIPVYVNNHLVGATNSHGKILVPNLIPYYPSEIRMDVNKIPMNAKFSYLTMFSTPRWKSGNIINFDVTKQRSVQMKMLDSSHNPLEVNRTLKIDGIADEILVGYNGVVYIEDIKDLDDITGTSCDDQNRCCSFNIPLNINEKDEIIDLDKEICK